MLRVEGHLGAAIGSPHRFPTADQADPGDHHQRAARPFSSRFRRNPKHRFVKTELADSELRRMHTHGQAACACVDVIPAERALSPRIQPALGIEREEVVPAMQRRYVVLERTPPHTIKSLKIVPKTRLLAPRPQGGTEWREVEESRQYRACLNHDQLSTLAEMAPSGILDETAESAETKGTDLPNWLDETPPGPSDTVTNGLEQKQPQAPEAEPVDRHHPDRSMHDRGPCSARVFRIVKIQEITILFPGHKPRCVFNVPFLNGKGCVGF